MTKTLLGMMLLAGGTLFAAPRVSIGVSFGNPAPVYLGRPACQEPGYVWVDGYRGEQGYWRAPVRVVEAPRYVAPRRDFDRDDWRFNNDRHYYDRRDSNDRRDFDRDDRRFNNDRHEYDRRDNDGRNDRDFGRGFRR